MTVIELGTHIKNEGVFEWFQKFYASCCDGEWEREHGITIQNTSNPGWSVKVGLKDTHLDGKVMNRIDRLRTDDDWIICHTIENVFIGGGGPLNLTEILQVFKSWADDADK
jgi:hypothetical protein